MSPAKAGLGCNYYMIAEPADPLKGFGVHVCIIPPAKPYPHLRSENEFFYFIGLGGTGHLQFKHNKEVNLRTNRISGLRWSFELSASTSEALHPAGPKPIPHRRIER